MRELELYEVINDAIFSSMADLHTITIAKVTAVNATTINCQPVISRKLDNEKIDLPEFIEVPPIFMQGGSSYTAHPIAINDYCLLLFTERCFDRWYAGQDLQLPLEARMHDYSDGFALVGINPQAGAITIPTVIKSVGDRDYTGNEIHLGDETHTGNIDITGDVTTIGNTDSTTYSVAGAPGATGVFVSADAKTITVQDGIIISIV